MFLRERFEGGRDSLAGAAPGCVDCGESAFFLSLFPCAPRERVDLTVDDNHSILGKDAGQLGGRAEDIDFRHGCLVGDGGGGGGGGGGRVSDYRGTLSGRKQRGG